MILDIAFRQSVSLFGANFKLGQAEQRIANPTYARILWAGRINSNGEGQPPCDHPIC